MHQFEPKKKYVEELEDTDESDPPSMSNNSDDEDEQNNETLVERVNPTDIDEHFLREIEDTGIRFQNTSLEEATCHTL